MSLSPLLASLKVPAEYARLEDNTSAETIERLQEWKGAVASEITVLRDLVREDQAQGRLSVREQASVVAAVAVFDGEHEWSDDTSRAISKEILFRFSPPSTPLLESLLLDELKPVFAVTPHPSLHPSTGRALARPAGGPLASFDFYEGQAWKACPGAACVLRWCVRSVPAAEYERLWHLLIPPVMTLLDDFEVPYKLQGVRIVSEMLQNVPPELLKRTGVDGLLQSSLTTSLTFLNNPLTPTLLEAALPVLLHLILLTTSPGSAARFDRLCTLLGGSIVGGVWFYASREPAAVCVTVEALPRVLAALGIGCARYLKALVPQLVHPFISYAAAPEFQKNFALQLASARALAELVEICAPVMDRWKGVIIDGVGRAWVALRDAGPEDSAGVELKQALRDVCARLAEACPAIVQEEYARLQAADAAVFGGLVGTVGRAHAPLHT